MENTLLEQLASANTLDELATVMENHVKAYGFSGFVYWTHLRVPIESLSNDNSFMLSRGPAYLKAFEALYLGKKLYADDPALQAITERHEPFTTADVRQRAASPNRRQRWLYALEQRFGFVHDVYIPVHTPLRVQVVYLYFQGNDPSYSALLEALLPQVQQDAALFTSCVVDFVVMGGSDESVNVMFTSREQECLAWMAKGRSSRDIASILEISERTVKFHIKNIMEKMNADNRTEAVAIAARSGWIMN